MFRRLVIVAALVAGLGLFASACGNDDADEAGPATTAAQTDKDDRPATPPDEPDDGENPRTETAEEPTEGPPAVTTGPQAGGSDDVEQAVFERSLSECASTPLDGLAAKYKTQRNAAAIAKAVGVGWSEQFGGGENAARAGRDGCLQGLQTS